MSQKVRHICFIFLIFFGERLAVASESHLNMHGLFDGVYTDYFAGH